MTTSSLITTARTLLSELQDRRTLAIAAGHRPLSDALLLLSVEYETLLEKLLRIYPDTEEAEWRYLLKGETVVASDEYKHSFNGWITVGDDAGTVIDGLTAEMQWYRRRIIPPADMDTLCRFYAEQCGKEQV